MSIKRHNTVHQIIKYINETSGLNIFDQTRKREYVEYRSLLMYILRTHYNYTLRDIEKLFKESGYPITHASAIHSLRSFEIYCKYNRELFDIYDAMIYELGDDLAVEITDFIIPKLKYLDVDQLRELSSKVKEMYEESIIRISKNDHLQT